MKRSVFSFLIASLALACGEDGTRVSMGDVNGTNANDARFAIFNTSAQPFDSDGDGVDELELAQLTIAVTDQSDLCAQLEDPFGQSNLINLKSVQIVAIKAVAPGESANAFSVNETLSSNQLVLSFFDGGAAQDDVFLDTIVQIKEDGDLLVDASGIGFVDLNGVSDSLLTLSEFTPNASLSGEFSITLEGDLADENRFDTDANGDNRNDYLLLNVPLSVSLVGATFCEALAPIQ